MILSRLTDETADDYADRVLAFVLDTGRTDLLSTRDLALAEAAYPRVMSRPTIAQTLGAGLTFACVLVQTALAGRLACSGSC